MQFYNCENRKIDFDIEIGGNKNNYSFTEDVKSYISLLKMKIVPNFISKVNLKSYLDSKENIFSFTPVLDKKIRATVNRKNIHFSFRNFTDDVLNEYLILLVKNHPPLKKNDLRNRSYIYKVMHE